MIQSRKQASEADGKAVEGRSGAERNERSGVEHLPAGAEPRPLALMCNTWRDSGQAATRTGKSGHPGVQDMPAQRLVEGNWGLAHGALDGNELGQGWRPLGHNTSRLPGGGKT